MIDLKLITIQKLFIQHEQTEFKHMTFGRVSLE